mmetsp:Transcript_97941/g.189094  ORF Transcript_97941/g.189094 Transcript_97941/m.189094 type:complete len:555 (-) Transcript_97941:120-1784(-)
MQRHDSALPAKRMAVGRCRGGSGRSVSDGARRGRRRTRRKFKHGNRSSSVRADATQHSQSPPTAGAAMIERPLPFSWQENFIYDATVVVAPRDFDLALKLERFARRAWTVARQSVRLMPHGSDMQIKILVQTFLKEWVSDFAWRAFQSAYSQGWNSDRLNPNILSTLMQDSCKKLDIVGTGAPWKIHASDGLIHHAVQSTWAQVMGTPSPRPSKAHVSPARAEEREERKEPNSGRPSSKFEAAGGNSSADDLQAAETRITELRAKLLEKQALQSAADRHRPPSCAEGTAAKAKWAPANQLTHIGTKGKTQPASNDRQRQSDSAEDMSTREDSEAQAAAAADEMVASLHREIRSAGSAKEQLELPEAPEHAEDTECSQAQQDGEFSPPQQEEGERPPPIDHDDEMQVSPAATCSEVDFSVNKFQSDPYLLASVLPPSAHDSDMLTAPLASSMVETASPPPAAVEASPPPPPPPPHPAPTPRTSSKRSFARPLRRMKGTTQTATSALHCLPAPSEVAGAAKDNEDSDEWPEEQLGDRLRMCFAGCGSGDCHCIDLS